LYSQLDFNWDWDGIVKRSTAQLDLIWMATGIFPLVRQLQAQLAVSTLFTLSLTATLYRHGHVVGKCNLHCHELDDVHRGRRLPIYVRFHLAASSESSDNGACYCT